MKYTLDIVKMARIRCQRFASYAEAERYFTEQGADIHAVTMSHWERGLHSPRVDKLLEWCSVMEVEPMELIKEELHNGR